MFGIIARTIQYTAFFTKLTAQHAVVDEFDPATNCARTTVVETGFPGNSECLDPTWTATRLDKSDVSFDDLLTPPREPETPRQPAVTRLPAPARQPASPPPPAPEPEMPAVAHKGHI
ncbi:MAG TPA: hypothetical protein VHM31_00650 [Polyangia bacterium]|nr:hypothetical protein [Polyangia bacterium]